MPVVRVREISIPLTANGVCSRSTFFAIPGLGAANAALDPKIKVAASHVLIIVFTSVDPSLVVSVPITREDGEDKYETSRPFLRG